MSTAQAGFIGGAWEAVTEPGMQTARAWTAARRQGVRVPASVGSAAWAHHPFSVPRGKCEGRGVSTSQTGGRPRRFPQTPEPFRHSRSSPVGEKVAV